ncbi:MAG: hypothetical protein AB1489_16410 [Acidobacteriota bacterium]
MKKCYILQEKTTSRYYFLDMNDTGVWLLSDSFSGAETFCFDERTKILKWLTAIETLTVDARSMY